MINRNLERFAVMSSAIGTKTDYVQGGGGNTSYKLDEISMAVKASGYRLNQINKVSGYVVLDYKMIRDFYNGIDITADIDYEKESGIAVKNSIKPFNGTEALRPSVEAGFHALLATAVIHSHSVYANLICCSNEGEELLASIFDVKELPYIYVPYVDPGFKLTLAIKKEIDKNKRARIIFMENHGLIVTGDDDQKALDMHTIVNERIKRHFGIGSKYPEVKLKAYDSLYLCDTEYIKKFAGENDLDRDLIDSKILYPDQLVYLNNNRSIEFIDDGIYYSTNANEAKTIEETLLAYIFVIDTIKKNNLTLRTMPIEGITFINGWESEKYRKKISEKN